MLKIADGNPRGTRTGKRKNLLSRGKFLNVAWKAAHWYKDSSLVEISYDKSYLYFKTKSHSRKNLYHTQTILLRSIADQLYYNKVAERTYTKTKQRVFTTHADKAYLKNTLPLDKKSLKPAIENSSLKLHCQCEMWKFWGFQYIAWKKGYGLQKEHRRPKVRNPSQLGFVCNHIFHVLAYVLPSILPSVERLLIRKGLLDYAKPSDTKDSKDAPTQ